MTDSKIRQDVLAALELLGGKATRDQIVRAMGNVSKGSVGVTLGFLVLDNRVEEQDGLFLLVEQHNMAAPGFKVKPYADSSNGRRVELPATAQKRSGRRVGIYALPDELEDVMQVQLYYGVQCVKIPLFSDLRICIGNGIPQWCAEQETNMGVTEVRVILRDGKYESYQVGAGQRVTIAPEEIA